MEVNNMKYGEKLSENFIHQISLRDYMILVKMISNEILHSEGIDVSRRAFISVSVEDWDRLELYLGTTNGNGFCEHVGFLTKKQTLVTRHNTIINVYNYNFHKDVIENDLDILDNYDTVMVQKPVFVGDEFIVDCFMESYEDHSKYYEENVFLTLNSLFKCFFTEPQAEALAVLGIGFTTQFNLSKTIDKIFDRLIHTHCDDILLNKLLKETATSIHNSSSTDLSDEKKIIMKYLAQY